MKEKIIAKRYAVAFMGYAKDSLGAERAIEELIAAKEVIMKDPEFYEFLQGREIGMDEKIDFIEKVFKTFFSKQLIVFIKLLLKKNRIRLLGEITDYAAVTCSVTGALCGTLKTAHAAGDDVRAEAVKKIEAVLKNRLEMNSVLDKRLIGGARVEMGNMLIDGSIAAKLSALKQKLLSVNPALSGGEAQAG